MNVYPYQWSAISEKLQNKMANISAIFSYVWKNWLRIQLIKQIKAKFFQNERKKWFLGSTLGKKDIKPILDAFSNFDYILVKKLTQNGQ